MKIYTDQFLREKILGVQEQSFVKLLEQKREWYECLRYRKRRNAENLCVARW